MKKYSLKDTELIIYPNGKFTICDKENANRFLNKEPNNSPNFEINICGEKLDLGSIKYIESKKISEGIELYYECKKYNLHIAVKLEFSCDSNTVIQSNKIKNIGNETVKLTKFSSAWLEDVVYSDNMPWYKNRKITVNICHSKWQGEGQWRQYSLPELGIYPTTIHESERESYKISSVGSWSTANFYPLVIIEDNRQGLTWFMETEGSHNWYIKLKAYGGYNSRGLVLTASSCDEVNGWYYDLKPAEEYSAERTVFGAVNGNFEDAVADLLIFKRADSTVKFNDGELPIVFNDYMDCIWGNQDPKLILPLVDKAAEAGCEVFCIDGGWCANEDGSAGLGDWLPKSEYYDMQGLKAIADYIKQKNMVPGIWLELEACQNTAYGYAMEKDSILKRYDTAIGDWRGFYNFSNPNVCEYLINKVETLYNLGFRYIKNDYNKSIGIGATNNYDGNSPAQGAIISADAFYDFIDNLYKKLPDLVIENCGSGALRCDNKMLRRCYLQSTSDQEIYINNPSIVMGSMAVMPPEKAGIWSYPYPSMYPYVNGKYVPFDADENYTKQRRDGKETVFNMVSAMTGYLYLSGRIEFCDAVNFGLIKESIDFYKKIRKYISVSRPIFPLGIIAINEKKTAALGLLSDNKLLLAIWNITDDDKTIAVPLEKYVKESISVNSVYPAGTKCVVNGKNIEVKLNSFDAAYFEINI